MSFAIEPSSEISNRVDFSILANARGYLDAVEVGVDQGVFAREFLSRWNGHWLLLVDPFAPYAEMPYDRTLDMLTAVQALMPYHGRYRFIREASPDAIPSVLRFIKAPDFVYIDGSHEERDVYRDLAAWWGLIPDHGMLAGHDFDEAHPGVQKAVERFARERDLVVRLTHETDFPASWYAYKGEPEQLMHRFFRDAASDNPHAAKG